MVLELEALCYNALYKLTLTLTIDFEACYDETMQKEALTSFTGRPTLILPTLGLQLTHSNVIN